MYNHVSRDPPAGAQTIGRGPHYSFPAILRRSSGECVSTKGFGLDLSRAAFCGDSRRIWLGCASL